MAVPHIALLNFHGDPNLGLHGVATDKFCLIGNCVREHDIKKISEVLQVPVFIVNLYGTDLVGLFAVANSSAVLLPEIIYPSELKHLRAELSKLGVKVFTLKTEHTAFGNNILLNDKAGILSTVYDKKTVAQIKKFFPEVKFEQVDIAGLSIPGSAGKVTNNGGIFNPNLSDADIAQVEKLFGFEIGLGTVNFGNPFVSSGFIANSFGLLAGANSSGYETARVDESLGFLKLPNT